ncbi:MAG TPA: hypothetical protein VFR68_06840 [Candidatus Dormibacteraeota bacterium]|nr:hypothetical protein [Candidatus Dormibacteraeota bacterium]
MFAIHRQHVATTLSALALAGGFAALTNLAQASADELPAFTCTDKSGGTSGVTGTITSIRVAHHDGFDRLVFGFATSLAVPPYELHRQATSTFTRDASGQPAMLDGSAGIRTVFRGSDTTNGLPTDLKPQLPEIREVANVGNFERVVSYGVGLKDQACFRAIELSGPSRLVIDVATPATTPSSNAVATSGAVTPNAEAATASQPSDLAATGHPASANQPTSMPLIAILGLLGVAAGLALAGLRRFRRQ